MFYGHGTDNAADEALFLVLTALGLDYSASESALSATLSKNDLREAERWLAERIETRKPAAYLAGKMWFAGHEFFVNEDVLVPRSPLAELINLRFAPWLNTAPQHILEIGTGSGCIAIALAHAFPDAAVDATDINPKALAVAQHNHQQHKLGARLKLYQADLFANSGTRYDLIVSNPPYVPRASMLNLPAEYAAEPRSALEAGDDGMDCVRRILIEARDHLTPDGLLVVEVGEIWRAVEQAFAQLPFTWVEFRAGGEGVFVLSAADFGCV